MSRLGFHPRHISRKWMGIAIAFLMGIALGVSEKPWLIGHYISPLSSTKGKWDINRVEMTFEDVLGEGSFGEPFAVAATPCEVGTVITVIAINNIVHVSISIYLLSVLFRFTYRKSSSQIRHLQWSCRYRFTNQPEFSFGLLALSSILVLPLMSLRHNCFKHP